MIDWACAVETAGGAFDTKVGCGDANAKHKDPYDHAQGECLGRKGRCSQGYSLSTCF